MDIWVGRRNLPDLCLGEDVKIAAFTWKIGLIQLVFSSIYSSYYLNFIMAKLHPTCHSSAMMLEDN